MYRRTRGVILAAILTTLLGTATPALASLSHRDVTPTPVSTHAKVFPAVIPLPDGFRPEGIATGRGTSFYVGSLGNGAIYRGDLLTGQGRVLVPGEAGRAALGLKVDQRNRLFVAGSTTGKATVYDAATGARLADYQITPPNVGFLNDVVVTKEAAYFTDSIRPFIYVLPFGRDGRLPDRDSVRALPLTGDYVEQQSNSDFCPQAPTVNANGIVAGADGRQLFVVQLNTGLLFTVDPATGAARTVDLGGTRLSCGDGLLLKGHTLYAVQNFLNKVAVVELDPSFTSGKLTRTITDARLDVPATAAAFGPFLYVVNARFTTTPEADTRYNIIRLSTH